MASAMFVELDSQNCVLDMRLVYCTLGTPLILAQETATRVIGRFVLINYCKVQNISEPIFRESIRFSIIADCNIRVWSVTKSAT